jgi:hypothetical protein
MKIDKFILEANCCKNSGINEFFSKTALKWWSRVDLFTKFVFDLNPVTTPQEVLDEYNRSLDNIVDAKDIHSRVVKHVGHLREQMIVRFSIFHYVFDRN